MCEAAHRHTMLICIQRKHTSCLPIPPKTNTPHASHPLHITTAHQLHLAATSPKHLCMTARYADLHSSNPTWRHRRDTLGGVWGACGVCVWRVRVGCVACVCSVCVACVLVTPAARCLLLQYTYRLRVILRHNIAVEFKGEIKRKSGANYYCAL